MALTDITTSERGQYGYATMKVGRRHFGGASNVRSRAVADRNSVGRGTTHRAAGDESPIGNSDYTRLALVLPGVTQNSNFAFAQYTINGSRSRSNGFNIDGASDTDPSTYLPSINEGGNSATAATRLPLDAIQEASIISAGGADSGT